MFKVEEMDESQIELGSLTVKPQDNDGSLDVPISELLNPDFLTKHTHFLSFDDLFEAGGFIVDSADDLKVIPGNKLDEFIRSLSPFENWQSLLAKASEEWAIKQLDS